MGQAMGRNRGGVGNCTMSFEPDMREFEALQNELNTAYENLTAVQQRCTTLLLENRALLEALEELRALVAGIKT